MFKRLTQVLSSLFSRQRSFNWYPYKSFIAIGLCLSFITIAALATIETGQGYAEPALTEHEAMVEFVLKNQFDTELENTTNVQYNRSLHYLLFMVPLYSKLNSSDITSNSSRECILSLITTQPGITLGAITRKLKLKNGTAMHHIRILEREEYIKSKKTGKFRRYYRLGVPATGFNELQDKIIYQVGEHPGVTQSQLARELNLSRQLLNYHLQELVTNQVIKLERLGNKSLCYSQT